VGFIPGLNRSTDEFDISEGYVIASYVGYDDNRPMKGRHMNLSGAAGALPLWIDTSNKIVNSQEYTKDLQFAALAFMNQSAPLTNNRDLNPINISLVTGLPLSGNDEEDTYADVTEVYAAIERNGAILIPRRAFQPLNGVNYGNEN